MCGCLILGPGMCGCLILGPDVWLSDIRARLIKHGQTVRALTHVDFVQVLSQALLTAVGLNRRHLLFCLLQPLH